jgi:hypothetical protein
VTVGADHPDPYRRGRHRHAQEAAQIGGYLRTRRGPVPVTERDPISAPACRLIDAADYVRCWPVVATAWGCMPITQFCRGASRLRGPLRCAWGRSQLEAGPYRVRDERLAEPGAHGVLCAPSCAVSGDDDARCHGAEVIEDERDERLDVDNQRLVV